MFLADFGAYDVQFEGFGGDYVFWAGSAQSEGRRLRLIDRMAYIGPRLRELQIIPYIGHTYA